MNFLEQERDKNQKKKKNGFMHQFPINGRVIDH